MKKNKPKVSHVSFKPKPIVLAVKHALPYLVALGLGAAAISPAVGRSGDSAAAFTATQLIRQFTLKNTVAQVSQGMQGYVAEFNGVLRASEMGGVVSGYPVDMGSVPSSVNLPQRDGAGRPLGYCAWDNSASTSNSSFLAGQGVANPLVYAVVSPGLNGGMETSCAYILANRSGLGDDYVQVTAPSQTSSKQFKSAVGTYAELTAMPGEEGDIRLVLETNKLYSYVGGGWQPVDASKFNDDSAVNGAGAIAYTTGKVTVADFQAASATITGALSGSAATFTSSVTANSFVGNGAALTDLNASNVNSGLLGAAFGGTGVDSSAAAQGSLLIGTGAGFALGGISAGDGIGVLNGAGSITISNTGVLSIAGTNNQVIASAMNGDVVLSLPQDIANTSTPTFGGMILNGDLMGTAATFSGNLTVAGASTFNAGLNITTPLNTNAWTANSEGNIVGLRTKSSLGGFNGLTREGDSILYFSKGTIDTGALVIAPWAGSSNGMRLDPTGVQINGLQLPGASVSRISEVVSLTVDGLPGQKDGFQIISREFGNPDFILFEKHDYNRAVPDGGIAFSNNGTSGRNYSLVIDGDGNVGIGLGKNSTTGEPILPGAMLDVNGTANFSGSAIFNDILQVSTDQELRFGTKNQNTDAVFISRTNPATDQSILRIAIGDNPGDFGSDLADEFQIGRSVLDRSTYTPLFRIAGSGNVISTGTITANAFAGDGSTLTNLNANNFTTGILPVARGGTGVDGSAAINGQLLIGNGTGYTLGNITGTANQINVVNGAGSITLSLPQDIATTSTPTFAGAFFTGNVDVVSISQAGTPATLAFQYSSDTGAAFYAEPNLGLGAGALAGRKNAGNVAVGDGVLGQMATTGYGTESGTWNTGVGYQALYSNDYGDENTALGYKSMYSNTTGYYNTASGAWSLFSNTTGVNNTASGYYSLQANTTGYDNVAVGAYALRRNTTGYYNSALGSNALYSNTTGYYNTAMGGYSMYLNTTGSNNTAVGNYALFRNSTGGGNTTLGAFAGAYMDASSLVTAIGDNAAVDADGSESVAIGAYALNRFLGLYHVSVGNNSLGSLTTGNSNTALGHYAMPSLSSGDTNIAIGHRSGNTITTGNRNILIGDLAANGTLTSNSNIALGHGATIGDALSYAVTIGNDSSVTTSNTVVLGRTIDNIVMGATSDDGSGNKLQVTGGLRASGNVFLNTSTATNYTQLRDLRVMSSADDAGWDHLRIRAGARSTSVDVGGAEDGLIFRVGQGSSGGIGDQTYNTVLTLKPDQSAVFAGRVDVQSLYVNGQQVAPVNKANIDAALTFASTVGAAYPQSSLALGINALDADPRAGNVAIGEGVLTSLSPSAVNTDGIFNTGVGFNALTLNSTGSNNTAVGTYTLNRNTSGYSNTAIGVYAMVNTTTGFDNVGVGVNALNLNSAGSRNNAVGVNALYSNSTGTKNNALGTNTLFLNTTGYQNVAIGDNALYTNSAGYQNVAVGPDALYNNTTGYQNIAMGYNSQRNTSTGYRNTSVGANALLNNTDGFENSAFGVNALLANTSGDYNSAFGMNSLLSNTLGERNVAVGFNTLLSNTTGSNNVAVGANALLKNTTGSENTAVGDNALFENTTGHSNAAVGRGALNNNTTGYYNIAVGRNALLTNSTGYNNSALGYNSLIFNTTGYNNAALGRNTLQNNTTGLNNTALGTYSMFGSTTGFDNTAVGLNSLYSNTTGNSNVSLGMNALFGNATGSYNMGLGRSSDVLLNNLNYASAIGAFARVTTSNTLVLGALGAGKDGVVSSVNDQVVIGTTSRNDTISDTIFHVAGVSNFSSTLYATGGAQISTNHSLHFGPDSESTDRLSIYRFNPAFDQSILRISIGDNIKTFGEATGDELQVGRLNPDNSFNPVFRVAGNGDVIASGYMQATAFNVSSDRRLKTNIRAQDSGSVLSRLEQLQTYSYEYLANPNLGRRIGVIAQEIQGLFPEAVATRADGMMSVDYSALGAMAAMGVGQLSKQVKVLDKTVADQGQRITVLDDRINQHDTRITSLESWRTDTSKRMDGMQTAIDLNIQKIAENTVAIQTNSAAIERLDDALFNLDGQVKNNSDLINNINARWARNFSESEDGSVLAVNAVELKVSNFTAQQLRANSVYSQRLEAEMARITDLEVNNLKANSAVANTVRAEQVNTGSAQVYAGVGLPAVLFAAKSDGHYTVSTSALDGSYATATVIVNAGQAKVVSVASEGIELYAEGNQVKVIAAGKSIKASWIKMG
ncbi:tail fiber domain-containing protein [Limnobacter sp. P1]|uniref:tail fiber domain-containing protein n=1 Tax=Limnobacter olei TaxID=3031298 RepID=UPI0023AFFAFF|nr:tail fiber domain-containing protein [Limnobacter sp. P1]